MPIGFQHVYLKSTNEHYSIKRPNSQVGNLLFGTMYLEHIGKLITVNHTNGNVCVLDFLPTSWYGVNKNHVKGNVYKSPED